MPSFAAVYPYRPTDRVTARAEPDWERDHEPVERGPDRAVFAFPSVGETNVRQLKVVLHRDGGTHWSQGANYVLRDHSDRIGHPVFFQAEGRVTGHMSVESPSLGDALAIRVFLPAGYDENLIRRYAVLYAMDGSNLFDPAESFGGREWEVDETVALLDRMAVIDKIVVVGVYAREGRREEDYTAPGYERLARALACDLVPWIDASFRTHAEPGSRAVLGSSLGGVFALHAFLRHPEVFGNGAAMSATFGWRDDLFARVARDPIPSGKVYLDAGYPHDNFEAVRKMAHALADRGAALRYVAHPRGLHSELHWADRLHLPLQYLFGDARN
jgi:predicted alpha/beta superfamily hydrolase